MHFFLGYVGDVDGSIEAINDAIATYKSKKIKLNVLSSKVGAVNENDIRLAQTFKGMFKLWNTIVNFSSASTDRKAVLRHL